MSQNKITNEEMGALLGAFADMQKELTVGIIQTTLFKVCLIFSNIYAISFAILYMLLRENIIIASNPSLLGEEFLAVFSGRASVIFWILASLNISTYFNIGFRIVSLCSVIYVLNSAFDNIFLFHEIISFSAAPYFSLYVLTNPVFAGAIAVMAITHKSSAEKI
jgi:hypothetical protein